MKTYLSFFLLIFLYSQVYSQVQITDLPEKGYEARIQSAVDSIWIIDTHEHLILEEARIDLANEIDFSYLFTHYAKEDLISASNQKGLIDAIYQHKFKEEDRWQLLSAYYPSIRSTGYGRVPLIAARNLFEVPEINKNTISILSQKLKEASKPGWYKYVLKDRSRIELSIQDMGHMKFDSNFYRHVERFDNFIQVSSLSEIIGLGDQQNIRIQSLDDYLLALRKAFEAGLEYGMVGVKSGLAYKRVLYYENVPEDNARAIFDAILDQSPVGTMEIKSLQDYFMHRVLDLVDEYDLPIQFHTGLLAGNGNTLTNSKPTHLTNLFMEYPEVDFILFHGGYPYGGELGALAKNFPNVFIDMCWMYVISPSYSERYLHEWIETVPANKIMAFGGDYSLVESVYAHSVMARQIISNVLIAKVGSGYLTEKEAIHIANLILRDNAIQIFQLEGDTSPINKLEVLRKPGKLHDWWKIHKTNEGFVKSWKVSGPFDYGEGLDGIYSPEESVQLEENYSGQGSVKIHWTTENITESGHLNLISVFRSRYDDVSPELEGIAYAYTELYSPDKKEVTITLGSNDGAKMWLNEQVVYNVHAGRAAFPDQDFLKVNLKKGWNTILVKVENLGSNWGLYLRIIDPDNNLKFKEY